MSTFTKEEREVLKEMAEQVVKIPPGEKVGKWDRESRVALVYAVLCGLFRANKEKQ